MAMLSFYQILSFDIHARLGVFATTFLVALYASYILLQHHTVYIYIQVCLRTLRGGGPFGAKTPALGSSTIDAGRHLRSTRSTSVSCSIVVFVQRQDLKKTVPIDANSIDSILYHSI